VAASSPKFWEGGAALGRGDVRVADAREWAAPGRAVSPAAADDVDVVGPADSVSAEPVCAAATPAQISSAAPIPCRRCGYAQPGGPTARTHTIPAHDHRTTQVP